MGSGIGRLTAYALMPGTAPCVWHRSTDSDLLALRFLLGSEVEVDDCALCSDRPCPCACMTQTPARKSFEPFHGAVPNNLE